MVGLFLNYSKFDTKATFKKLEGSKSSEDTVVWILKFWTTFEDVEHEGYYVDLFLKSGI